MNNFEFDSLTPVYHANMIITLGELVDNKIIDWTLDKWKWNAYNEEQYKRCCGFIEDTYYIRELRFIPVEVWRKKFMAKANLLMEKLYPIYDFINDNPDFFQTSHEYEKERYIGSAFPQTMLSGNSDYATDGTDKERELIKDGNVIQTLEYMRKYYRHPDEIFVDGLEPLFLQTFTTYVNGL